MGKEEKSEGKHDIPEYLRHPPKLYVRQGGQIIDAPNEDIIVARMYPDWPNKGTITNGRRITILARKTTYRVNEIVRVIHVVEVIEFGYEVYVMGPKKVYGEYLDGTLVTEPLPDWEDPLVPPFYDGAVLPSPAVDYNYEITSYSFAEPGVHEIIWRLRNLQSNTIKLKMI